MYFVSNLGRIKRGATKRKLGTGNYERNEHILSTSKNNTGYYIVSLYKCNIRKQFLVHRLVAQAFLPNPHNYPVVNHKDENPANNNVENLEWCTQKYNMNYGTCPKRIGKSNSKKIIMFSKKHKQLKIFNSIIEAQRETGISNGSIGDCLHNRRKTAGGYRWEYAE